MHAAGKHAAAAWMWNVEIFLHHLAGAADLVADQGTRARQQQVMHGALDAIAFRLVLRRDVGRQRLQRGSIAPRRCDDAGSGENSIHGQRPSPGRLTLAHNINSSGISDSKASSSELISNGKKRPLQVQELQVQILLKTKFKSKRPRYS